MPDVKRFVVLTYEEGMVLTTGGISIEVITVCKWLLMY